MNRRAFIQAVCAGFAAAVSVQVPSAEVIHAVTYDDITRSTFVYWQRQLQTPAQQTQSFDALLRAMRTLHAH